MKDHGTLGYSAGISQQMILSAIFAKSCTSPYVAMQPYVDQRCGTPPAERAKELKLRESIHVFNQSKCVYEDCPRSDCLVDKAKPPPQDSARLLPQTPTLCLDDYQDDKQEHNTQHVADIGDANSRLDQHRMVRKRTSSNQHPAYDTMIALANSVFQMYGTGYTERVYQEGMYFSAYKKNIPCLMERNVYVTHDSTPLFIGKVDLEVAGRYVFELKIHPFNTANLKKDTTQLEKYLRAYAMNHHIIRRAALIYFTENGVRVVEVDPFPVEVL
jgi:hypothetical protein